jgi:chemotaxis signal transduction protein
MCSERKTNSCNKDGVSFRFLTFSLGKETFLLPLDSLVEVEPADLGADSKGATTVNKSDVSSLS